MIYYIINVFLTGILSYAIANEYKKTDTLAIKKSQKSKVYFLFFMILLVWTVLYALRGTTGTDAGGYRNGYKIIYYNSLSIQKVMEMYRDQLYAVVAYFCSTVSKGSWIFGSTVMGLIIYLPTLYTIKKKSEDVFFSCVLYLLFMTCFFGYNGIRQGLSSGIAFMAYYVFLREKKYVKYALLMLIAYGFHAAVIFIIPFHLLSLKKLKAPSTILILAVLLGTSFFLQGVWESFFNMFSGDSVISKYDSSIADAHGSGIMRVLVWLAPVAVSIYNYSPLKVMYDDVDHDILMVIIGAIFMMYSMQSVIFSQMSLYFEYSLVILIPKIINSLSQKDKNIIRPAILILGFVYMIMLLYNGDSGLCPYKPVWETRMY